MERLLQVKSLPLLLLFLLGTPPPPTSETPATGAADLSVSSTDAPSDIPSSAPSPINGPLPGNEGSIDNWLGFPAVEGDSSHNDHNDYNDFNDFNGIVSSHIITDNNFLDQGMQNCTPSSQSVETRYH